MSKIRINDLARELEVKSKAILDVLEEVGVTEKKTHSSSIEDHEAVKVREHFRSVSEAQSASKSARSSRAEADGIKTKIDLSHISKPGDVLNAIRAKQQVSSPPRLLLFRDPQPVIDQGRSACRTASGRLLRLRRQQLQQRLRPSLLYPVTLHGLRSQCQRRRFKPPDASASGCPGSVAAASPRTAPANARCAAELPPVSRHMRQTRCESTARAVSSPAPAQPYSPPPRMIMPQTGPRPVYKAPPRAAAPAPQAGAPSATCTGTSSTRSTNFSAAASGCSYEPSGIASGRTAADASDAPVSHRHASYGSWTGSASGTSSSRKPSGSSVPPAWSTLCSARCEGRPDEGLHSAAAADAF